MGRMFEFNEWKIGKKERCSNDYGCFIRRLGGIQLDQVQAVAGEAALLGIFDDHHGGADGAADEGDYPAGGLV